MLHSYYYLKGGDEERDRRLQEVKLLTALNYCVGSSIIFCVPALLVLGSLSLLSDACQPRTLNRGWVGMGGWVWVVDG